jgi:hypothetical protein
MAFDFKKTLKRELNVGLKDQKTRYWLGSAALLASVFLGNIPLLVLGSVFLATAYLRWCPVYSGMSKNTSDSGDAASCCGAHQQGSH